MNAQHKNIKFTSESEVNNRLPFFNDNVTKINHEFTTSVYRKPSYTGLTTTYDSYTPSVYKNNIVPILIYRAFTISRDYLIFHTEVEFILKNLCKTGFCRHYVRHMIKQFLNKIYSEHFDVSTVSKESFCETTFPWFHQF